MRFKNYLLLFWVVFICCLTFYIIFQSKGNDKISNEGNFWVFTDSHVDVLYRQDGDPATFCHTSLLNNTEKIIRKFGHFDCNTPSELLRSAFSAAKKIDSKIDFIIWLGDTTSHSSRRSDTIISVSRNFSQEIINSFPNIPIIPVIGNHDVILKGNRSTRFREFYYETKYNLLLNDSDAVQTFIKGGYYSLRFGTLKDNQTKLLRFVVLNTAMFQAQYADDFDPHESIEQIQWFNKTMSDAYKLNDRILLLMHVPFGLNENLLYKFYDIKFEQKLLSIIDIYSSNIIMCFSGHRHQDIFRLYLSSKTKMGIIGHPSISPIGYLSEPSIRKYSYNRKSLILNDYEQYALHVLEAERTQKDQWKFSYRFSSWYHRTKELTSDNLFQLIYLIRTNPFYLKRFILTKYHADNKILEKHQIIQTLCALTLFNFDEFISCSRILGRKSIQYDNIVINNTLATSFHMNEQLIEYRIIYRRIAFSLFIFLIIISYIIYRFYLKIFLQ